MTDTSFTAAGYAILTEDDPNQKFTSVKKSYAPIAYGLKTFIPSQLKMSIYAKEFLYILLYITHLKNSDIYSGDTQTGNYPYRQQIGHKVLPDQDHTAAIMECM